MSGAKTCHFYLKGNCKFGSSCRFSHSDGQSWRPNHNNSYYDNDKPRNANQQYYGNKTWKQHDRGDYESIDRYEENRHYNNSRNSNQYVEKNYNNSKNNNQHMKKNYNNRNDYYEEEVEHFNHYNSVPTSSNGYKKNSNNHVENNMKKQQDNLSQKEKILKRYSNEVKMYQLQMNQMLVNNYWPLSCYNPIGNSPAVEPVGSLNLIDVSFEELRCDFYNVKNICANPELIHAPVYENLLLKAKKQKEDILALKDHVLDDLAATFEKYEFAKTCSTFQNSIPVDQNCYWDMSSKYLKNQSDNKTLDTFSFAVFDKITDTKDTGTKTTKDTGSKLTKDTGPKILMQTDVYGKMDKGFDEEYFIDYVPIMPPPEKCCI